MKSLEELLAPVSDDAPSGEDLDESVEFDRLRGAFDVNFPIDARVQELAEGEPAPEAVDWDELLELIEELGDKTKNVFLSVAYARAGFCLRDPDVVERGLQYTVGLFEDFWDSAYPTVDGDYGPQGRALICDALADRGAFALPFLELPVVAEERIKITADELRVSDDEGAAADAYPDVMRGLDQLEDEAKARTAERLANYIDSIDRIEAALKEKSEAEVPDFSTTRDYLQMVQTAFSNLAGLNVETAEDDAEDEEFGEADSGGGGGGASFGGAVRTRDDVLKALTAIEQYYARSEPGHPVKIGVGRLRGWVTMDFMQILEDIAPNSVEDAKSVLLDQRDVE